MFVAAERGDVEEVKRLLDQDGGLIEARDVDDGNMTPLIVAALEGHVEVVRLLVERGADIEAQDADGNTALHMVAYGGHEDVVAFLLSRGGDASAKDNGGSTPLQEASIGGHVAVVRLLLQHLRRGGVNDANNEGCTALRRACRCNYPEIARVLLLAGADHAIADREGVSPLQVAQSYDHEDTVAILQWWGGELERGYVLHRARYHLEKYSILQPMYAAITSSITGMPPAPAHLRPRLKPPQVEIVSPSEEQELGRSKAAEDGKGEGACEGEKEAILKYVMHDLAPELYIELMAGFH